MYSSFNARAIGLADLPVEVTISVAAAAGFAGVDLMIRDLVRSGANLPQIRHRMDVGNLRAGAFPLPVEWRGAAELFQNSLAELPMLAQAAAKLGFARTGTWVCPETATMPPPDGDPAEFRARFAQFHVDRIGTVARILADHGIRLGLEVIGVASFRRGHGVPFITRLSELEPDLSSLRAQANIGLLVDAFHLHAAAEAYTEALAWGVDRVVWAHVADLPVGSSRNRAEILDANRGLPGSSGIVDCSQFLDVLAQAGYDGPVTVEPLEHCSDLIGQTTASAASRVKAALDACWPTRSQNNRLEVVG